MVECLRWILAVRVSKHCRRKGDNDGELKQGQRYWQGKGEVKAR